jgi:hypothetical protein
MQRPDPKAFPPTVTLVLFPASMMPVAAQFALAEAKRPPHSATAALTLVSSLLMP